MKKNTRYFGLNPHFDPFFEGGGILTLDIIDGPSMKKWENIEPSTFVDQQRSGFCQSPMVNMLSPANEDNIWIIYG